MAGRLSSAIAVNGVTAYQDRDDVTKFHYMPNRIDAVIDETLKEFKCSYFGIGEKSFYQSVNGLPSNISGGVVSGQAVPDATEEQKAAILKEITKVTGVKNPYLAPLTVDNAALQPVFADAVAKQGSGASSTFPNTFAFGSSFNFNVSSGNSLFAQLVAVAGTKESKNVSSFIGANLTGTTELYGDPWRAKITVKMSKVWDYVRSKGDATATAGWFNFGAAWDKTARDLKEKSYIKMDITEGTGGDEFGRAMLEATRAVFDNMNAKIIAGEGLFKFEPNPQPQEPKSGEKSWGSSLLPYGVAINLSFASDYFSQEKDYEMDVSFTGRVKVPVISSMNLSGVCSATTKHMFYNVQDSKSQCVDEAMMRGWEARMTKEVKARSAAIAEYRQSLINGKINRETYEFLIADLNTNPLTDALDERGNPISVEDAAKASYARGVLMAQNRR